MVETVLQGVVIKLQSHQAIICITKGTNAKNIPDLEISKENLWRAFEFVENGIWHVPQCEFSLKE